MSNLEYFMADNVEKVSFVERVISERFKEPVLDNTGNQILSEDGRPLKQPIKWKIAPIESEQEAAVRKACTKKVPIPGRKGMFQPEVDIELYQTKMAVACVMHPDLHNAKLQDSYGVKGAEALIRKMLLPGEFVELSKVIQEVNGYELNINDLVDEAKN